MHSVMLSFYVCLELLQYFPLSVHNSSKATVSFSCMYFQLYAEEQITLKQLNLSTCHLSVQKPSNGKRDILPLENWQSIHLQESIAYRNLKQLKKEMDLSYDSVCRLVVLMSFLILKYGVMQSRFGSSKKSTLYVFYLFQLEQHTCSLLGIQLQIMQAKKYSQVGKALWSSFSLSTLFYFKNDDFRSKLDYLELYQCYRGIDVFLSSKQKTGIQQNYIPLSKNQKAVVLFSFCKPLWQQS